MEDIIYYNSALKAYNEKDYKRCLILLKRINLTNSNNINLYILCCYNSWKLSCININELYQLLLNIFNINKDNNNITSYNYIIITHIYLKNGLIINSLKLLQYIGYNGYYNSFIIIIQTWSILKKLNNINEMKRFFNYLCDLLPLEIPEEHENGYSFIKDSDLPMSICYIFCGYYLQIEAVHIKEHVIRKQLLQKSDAMLIEAYTYAHLSHPFNKQTYVNWIKKSITWIEIGKYLEETPFLLLSEDAFWIAFLCDPRNDERVIECLRLLKEHNRESESYSLCEKMYSYNKWNIYCRKKLLEYDSDKYLSM